MSRPPWGGHAVAVCDTMVHKAVSEIAGFVGQQYRPRLHQEGFVAFRQQLQPLFTDALAPAFPPLGLATNIALPEWTAHS